MNKTIKKIVALGIGSTMFLGTAAMALGATLADYPSPFVANNAFVGKIVIGEKAAAVDTLGSMDIAASLQRASSSSVGSTSGGTTAMAEDGYRFSESNELILGYSLADVTTVVDETELPDMLASGTVEDSDGSDYDYDVEIQFTAGLNSVKSDVQLHDLDDEYSAPIVYYELDGSSTDIFYSVVIDFDKVWDVEDFADSESIELFGRAYTFDPNNANDDDILTLFGSDTTLIVSKGETKTVTYNNKEYTIEVLGGNSDDSNAILRIGSETKTVSEGNSRTLGGLPIYVKDVFISNIGGDDVSVQLFIGSNKMELDEDGTVTLNGVELDSVTFDYTQGSGATETWDNVDTMTFIVEPTEDDVEYILPGEDYVDPLFGAFKFHFVGAEDLMEGKELVEFSRSGRKLVLDFTPRGGAEETSITLFDDNDVEDDFFDDADLTDLVEDNIFIYNEDYDGTSTTEDEAITHILQITKITDGNDTDSEDFEIVIKDLTFGKTYTVDSDTKAIDSKIPLYAFAGTDEDEVSFDELPGGTAAVTYTPMFFTNAGAMIQFGAATANATNEDVITDASEIDGSNFFLVTEDVDDDDDTATVAVWWVTTSWSADNEYDLDVASVGNAATDDDDDVDHYLTDFGSYILAEQDDAGQYVKMYIPEAEVFYDMFLLPIDATVTVTSTGGGSAVALNPIAVGMAILDSDATLGSRPYIVVGGSCANTVAAALMGNPADCTQGFTEGKAMIKLYDSQNALLVAGYTGKDTQGASRVLSNYRDYAFSGTELEVITTNLNSLSVNKVN